MRHSNQPRSFLTAWTVDMLMNRCLVRHLALVATTVLILAVSTSLLPSSFAQQGISAPLVKDINTEANSSYITKLTPAGDHIFFVNDSIVGKELWQSDGSAAGTGLMRDIEPGFSDSDPDSLLAVGSTVFFAASDNVHGRELWRSDGTAEGTQLVKDIFDGTLSSNPQPLGTIGATLFFSIEYDHQSALWRSDPPYTSATPVKQLAAGEYIQQVAATVGTTFFFVAETLSKTGVDFELWRSDGTEAGTKRVLSRLGYIRELQAYNGSLIIGAGDSDELSVWKSEGTAAGTQLLFQSAGTQSSSRTVRAPTQQPVRQTQTPTDSSDVQLHFEVSNNVLYIQAASELWRSDGTAAGTTLVTTVPETEWKMKDVAGTLYYGGTNQDDNTWALWKTGGSAATTVLLTAHTTFYDTPLVDDLTAWNGRLAFQALDYDGTEVVWTSDGTVAGTQPLQNVPRYAYKLAAIKKNLFFEAYVFADRKYELWTSDGTPTGAHRLTTTQSKTRDAFGRVGGKQVVSYQGKLVLIAEGYQTLDVWNSDGTADGTMLLRGFATLDERQPNSLIQVNNRLFFVENVLPEHAVRLWTSDGTPYGTTQLSKPEDKLKDLVGQAGLGTNLVAIFSTVGPPDELAYELWTSDGTAAGTVKQMTLPDTFQLEASQAIQFGQTPLNGKLYFLALTDQLELWQTDGTAAGTSLVQQIADVKQFFSAPVVYAGALYFTVERDERLELWRSDGTADGTTMVRRIEDPDISYYTYLNNSYPEIISIGNQLFFNADDGVHGNELWTSDGTAAGTHIVADFFPGYNDFGPSQFADIHGTLLFAANDSAHGRELWSSDGTAAGTHLVDDIAPGPYDSRPSNIAAADGFVGLVADDGTTGRELHRIDVPSGASLQLTPPPLMSTPPQSDIDLPITYGNTGATSAVSLTLTLTLGPGLAYISDTSSISPTMSGGSLTWALPDTTFLVQRSFHVRVAARDQPLGTRIPIDITMRGHDANGTPVEASAHSEVMLAKLIYLPSVRQ